MFDWTRCLIEAFLVIEDDMRQMRAQPLVIVIRQEREKPVSSSTAVGHALLFPMVVAGIERQSPQASQSASWSSEPPAKSPRRHLCRYLPGRPPGRWIHRR